MRIVLANRQLGLGGSESYVLTVGEELERLGHEVTVYAEEFNPGLVEKIGRGLQVVGDLGSLPESCDAAIVQDGVVAHALAERYPCAARVFVAHSDEYVLQTPPQISGAVDVAVALNDRIAARLCTVAERIEVVRLRQPIDVRTFHTASAAPDRPRSALALGNYLRGARLAAVERACAATGIELVRAGVGRPTTRPETAIRDADMVIGLGRCVLEAIASERPAYVLGLVGTDGWVTRETYPALEADGFSGRALDRMFDEAALCAEIVAPPSGAGPVGRDLVLSHHAADKHAMALVSLIERLSPARPAGPVPHAELARLTRAEWRATNLGIDMRRDNRALREQNLRLGERCAELDRELADLHEENARLWTRVDQAEAASDAAAKARDEMAATRRFRVVAALARPLDLARNLLGRRV